MGVIYELGAGSAGENSQWLVGGAAFYGYFLVLTGWGGRRAGRWCRGGPQSTDFT
jgi:hypothetical protein